MLFGFGNRNQPTRRGLLGGNLRSMALAGAGMLAMRWWRNRQNLQASRRGDDRSETRNPVHGWQ